MPELRDYQQQGLRDVAAAIREGHRRIVIASPTGSGKSVMIAAMVRKVPSALAVVHRKELVNQLYDHFTLPEPEGLGLDAGVLMAKDSREDRTKALQVASIQTLAKRPPLEPAPTIILADEAHHSTSQDWAKVLSQYPKAIVLGTTASPFRLDGTGLGVAGFTKIVTVATPPALIAAGYLVDVTVCGDPKPLDLAGVRKRGGEFVEKEVEAIMMPGVGDTVRSWEKHCVDIFNPTGRLTLGFGVTVAHSQAIAQALRDKGYAAEHVDASTPCDPPRARKADLDPMRPTREGMFARLRSGVTRVLMNVGIATEGVDVPSVEAVLMARPTASLCMLLQMVGRALRPYPGKKTAIIVDVADNIFSRHGWPTRDISAQYTLEGSVTPKGTRVPGCRRCPECFGVFPATQPWPCPYCKFMPKVKQLRALDRHLQVRELKRDEVRDPPTESEQFGYFAWLFGQAMIKNYARGWIFVRFKVRFGRAPPAEFWSKVKASRRASG